MVYIFFVPGMFGSTVEYVLRTYSTESKNIVEHKITPDGSLHTFKKYAHPCRLKNVNQLIESIDPSGWIVTPIYPFSDAHFTEILNVIENYFTVNDKKILIYSQSLRDSEFNMLCQYHKIANGVLNAGLDIFCNGNEHNIINWNKDYRHWSDMQLWELREWVSLFYVNWTQEWQNSIDQVDDTFLKIKNIDLIHSTYDVLEKIINHCGLTKSSTLDDFSMHWRKAQQYIVNEFSLLDNIIDSTLNNHQLSWGPVNIIAEAIVQQRLRALGYEIRCDGLNTFPTDSKTLYNLLEKV